MKLAHWCSAPRRVSVDRAMPAHPRAVAARPRPLLQRGHGSGESQNPRGCALTSCASSSAGLAPPQKKDTGEIIVHTRGAEIVAFEDCVGKLRRASSLHAHAWADGRVARPPALGVCLCQVAPWRWISKVAQWHDAWWRHTVGAVHHTESDRRRMRFGRGHRELGKRRRDEPVQRHHADAGFEFPWYEVAFDRTVWNSLEFAFVALATRCGTNALHRKATPGRDLLKHPPH